MDFAGEEKNGDVVNIEKLEKAQALAARIEALKEEIKSVAESNAHDVQKMTFNLALAGKERGRLVTLYRDCLDERLLEAETEFERM